MANEATLRVSLQIRTGSLFYQSQPTSFQADVDGTKGPSPGAVTVSVLGTDISFAQLDHPSLCRIQNLDDTNFVTVGIYDGTSFFPLLEVLPGESYPLRLSRYLSEEFVGTGTNADANTLRIMADTASCDVLVEAFER